MSMCLLFQRNSRRCIKPNIIQKKNFFSLINKTRLTALKPIGKKINVGFSGLVVTAGIGYVAWNKFENYQQIEFLKKKIKEFLDSIQKSFIVLCESDVKQNRTAFYEETIGLDEKNKKREIFDWGEFFKLIWKEKFYFLSAVIVNN